MITSNVSGVNDVANADDEVNNFLQPYRTLIADHEDLQNMRVEKCVRQQEEILNQVHAFQKDVSDIDKKTLDRFKVITNNASLIKGMLQEKIANECIAVGHQFQKEIISAVEGVVGFTNNFPQLMKISCQAPTTDGAEILVPLEDAVSQFNVAITKGENSMETIIQCKDHLQSMADKGGKHAPS